MRACSDAAVDSNPLNAAVIEFKKLEIEKLKDAIRQTELEVKNLDDAALKTRDKIKNEMQAVEEECLKLPQPAPNSGGGAVSL